MKKKGMKSAVLGAMVAAASVATADESTELNTLKQQVQIQKQELAALMEKMELIEKNQTATTAQVDSMGWASNIILKGDFRYRYESREDDDGLAKSRQRLRARIGMDAKVNDEVKFGLRLATGGNATSTNQDVDGNFDGKGFYLDRAYVTYSPQAVDGLDVTLGKMAKPWFEASDLVFDGDLNPEGIAATYKIGPLIFAAGNFVAEEELSDDVRLRVAQIAADLSPSEEVKATVGLSYFGITNDENGDQDSKGNDLYQNGFDIVEAFAVADVNAGMPLSLTGHYVMNGAADENESAYLVGFGTKAGKWKFAYNYRHVEANSVVEGLNDGDFGQGKAGWKGSKLSAGYSLSKNFSAGASYFLANEEINGDGEMDMLQLDLKAKF